MKVVQMIAKNEWGHRLGVAVAIAVGLCGVGSSAEDKAEKRAAVDAERYAEFIDNEVFDVQDLAEGAEIQRRFFNRITPPGISLLQPMTPSLVPFDSKNFEDSLLDDLLGEDKNSVAIYPLSLALDPKTRETLVYNADGKLIATIPSDKAHRTWTKDADPSRVTLQLDLLPSEDIEPYLYTESRIAESSASKTTQRRTAQRSLGSSEFGICNFQKLTNSTMRLTVTNGADVAEVFSYTVLHTSSVVVVTWTNEDTLEVFTDTNTLWTPVSPPFNGRQSAWEYAATNLALTNGVGIWEDINISSNARTRFYGVAGRMDTDGDRLTDGAEIFLYHTESDNLDSDGDGLLDGYDIVVGIGDSRYDFWTNFGIVFFENEGFRIFNGELSADTNPLNEDSDSDGLLDGWEVQNGLDPLDADGVNGPEGDLDEDGFDNGLEWELGAPANNGAWNGNELAYRLTHAHPATNARWGATNLIGMRVDIDRSLDCGGTNDVVQDRNDFLVVPSLLECGYYINITVTGSVEDVDTNYDIVTFEAVTNCFYFMGHNGIPDDGTKETCQMVGESAMRNNLIFAHSTVRLRYNTVGHKWHSGAYAEIIEATNTEPYKVVVDGDDAICVGQTTLYGATGVAGAPYTWLGSGSISVSTNGHVTGLAPGFSTVTAIDSGNCIGNKKVMVLKPDMSTPAPLADLTLHPTAARKPLLLNQTLPAVWNGLMELSLSGANAYWTPTGGMPIASGIFTNSQLPQTVYLEGDGCGSGQASFSMVDSPGCGTNVPLQIFGMNATLTGVAELDEEIPGGFMADHTTHTNAPRTLLTLDACGPSSATGNVVLAWNSALVQMYTVPTGGTALAQFSRPYNGFHGTNLYVEGIAPGSNVLTWSYSEQAGCVDKIMVTVLKVEIVEPVTVTRGTSGSITATITPAVTPDKVEWIFTGGIGGKKDTTPNLSTDVVLVDGDNAYSVACKVTVGSAVCQDSATITVTPRNWTITPTCATDNESGFGSFPGAVVLGYCRNRTLDNGRIVTPTDGGFTCAQVNDPNGPNDDYWYIESTTLEIDMETVINKYTKAGTIPPTPPGTNWHEYNESKGIVADSCLIGIKGHEYKGVGVSGQGHFAFLEAKESQAGMDARTEIEKNWHASSETTLTTVTEAEKDSIDACIYAEYFVEPSGNWGPSTVYCYGPTNWWITTYGN